MFRYRAKTLKQAFNAVYFEYIQLIQLRLTSTIVKWQMCNMHERKK